MVSILTGRIAVQVASLISGIIIARFLGVEGKGTIAAIMLAPQLIVTIAEFGVRNAATYHIGQDTWPIERIVQTTLFMAVITGGLGLLLSLSWILLSWEQTYTPVMTAFAVLMVPGAIIYTYVAGIFLGLQHIPQFAISNWGPGVFKLIGTVLFVGIAGYGITGAVGAVTLSVFLVSYIMLKKLSTLTPLTIRFDKKIAQQMAAIGSPFAIVYFLMVMVYKSNIFLVQIFSGIEALGYYSLSCNIAAMLWLLPAVMSALVFTRSAGADDELVFSKKVASLARITFLVSLCGGITLALLAPILVELLYGERFLPSADILVALLPGTVAMVVFKILRQDLSGRGKPWAAVWIIVPMLLFAAIAGVIVIPVYGAYGAAVSMSVIYVLGTVGFIFLYAQVSCIPIRDLVAYQKSDFVRLFRVIKK